MSALPAGWQELTDPGTGKTYYFHEATNTTHWDRPAADAATPAQGSTAIAPMGRPGDANHADAGAQRAKHEGHRP